MFAYLITEIDDTLYISKDDAKAFLLSEIAAYRLFIRTFMIKTDRPSRLEVTKE